MGVEDARRKSHLRIYDINIRERVTVGSPRPEELFGALKGLIWLGSLLSISVCMRAFV